MNLSEFEINMSTKRCSWNEQKQSLSPIFITDYIKAKRQQILTTKEVGKKTRQKLSMSNVAANMILVLTGKRNINIVWKISHGDNNDHFEVIINYLWFTQVKCQTACERCGVSAQSDKI